MTKTDSHSNAGRKKGRSGDLRPYGASTNPEFRTEQAASLRRRLGTTIAKKRRALGIPQHEVAKRCGTTQSYICEIEQGDKNPTWEILVALCSALGISLTEIVVESEFGKVRLKESERKMLDSVLSAVAALRSRSGTVK